MGADETLRRYTVCPSCHSEKHRVKSWVSLNGVLNGDILPSIATGFSFSALGSRPVVNASVAEAAGCRPITLVSKLPANNALCVDEQFSPVDLDRPRDHPSAPLEPTQTRPVTADEETPAPPRDDSTSETRDVESLIVGLLVVLYLAFLPQGTGVHPGTWRGW